MTCFVTVGTTSFDRLIEMINGKSLRQLLVKQFSISHLIIQYGRGTVKPDLTAATAIDGLVVDSFDFKPTLMEEMNAASLIISHAGAGSIMEALRLDKPLIVVVNDALMDNHQVELAQALERGGYLAFASSPKDLVQVVSSAPIDTFKPYPKRDEQAFANMLDREMGF